MKRSFYYLSLIVLLTLSINLSAQNEAIVFEAESGVLGSDWEVMTDDDIQYVTSKTDYIPPGTSPGNESKVITYTIEFPYAGRFDLYVRLRVGPQAWEDDSFYFGRTFGEKSDTIPDDWVRINGVVPTGYTLDNDVVDGEGNANIEVWKWMNITKFDDDTTTFTVEGDDLIQIFQIGGREDGLDIDKIAFGRTGYYYTVKNLMNGESGSDTPPDPDVPDFLPIAHGQDKWLGNIYSRSQLQDFQYYWNQVTPENDGKWGHVEGTRDVMNWTQLDIAYNLAKDNGFPFRFHVLVWGNQQPRWIVDLPPDEQLEEIKEWFQAVAERYPDIDYLEVVNEPLHDPPNEDPGNAGAGNYIEALGGLSLIHISEPTRPY